MTQPRRDSVGLAISSAWWILWAYPPEDAKSAQAWKQQQADGRIAGSRCDGFMQTSFPSEMPPFAPARRIYLCAKVPVWPYAGRWCSEDRRNTDLGFARRRQETAVVHSKRPAAPTRHGGGPSARCLLNKVESQWSAPFPSLREGSTSFGEFASVCTEYYCVDGRRIRQAPSVTKLADSAEPASARALPLA